MGANFDYPTWGEGIGGRVAVSIVNLGVQECNFGMEPLENLGVVFESKSISL